MIEPPSPTLQLRIDEDALAENWCALNEVSGSARAGAAVKADCYGLGADRCVPVLRDAGCRDFFVAHWSEVAGVVAHVPAAQVAVLHGPISAAECEYAQATGAVPVINSVIQAELWAANGGGACHLMVDTGINRLGIRPEEADHPAIRMLDVSVLMSHLADADVDGAMNAQQLAAFENVRAHIPHRETSLSNSAGIGLGDDYRFDLTRPGLALYGGVPRRELASKIRQVAYPRAAILQTRWIEAGEAVGYNATFRATERMRIGVVSLGYADGILRAWGGAALAHEGRCLPILGKVSMDMIVLDLADAADIGEGDWVNLPYRLPDAAQQTGLSQYELLTLLGNRFART
ncbi:alanine racemase [Erythrobacter litoralis]|uniref:alanine racemase n=1 Tax=Erythrobacter litoralis TaxID=39960 RepID=UPI003D6F8E63